MINIDEIKTEMLSKSVEEILNILPLAVCIKGNDTKFCFDLFRHNDGEWVATYEQFGGYAIQQAISFDIKTCLTNLYCSLIIREDLYFFGGKTIYK